jgi:hypothetical protein
MMRFALALVCAGACFSPGLSDMPFHCGPNDECPPDYQCIATWCQKPGTPGSDAGGGTIDAPVVKIDSGTMCLAGSFLRCRDGHTAVFCSGNGHDEVEESCAFQCDAQQQLCEQCNPAQPTSCAGKVLETCSATGQVTMTTCAGWCEMGSVTAACVTLAPSNLPEDTCASTTTASFRSGNTVPIDTTACAGGHVIPRIGGVNGPPGICVLVYRDFRLDEGGVLQVSGDNALAIVGVASMRIDGTIDAGATAEKAGAGASPSGVGAGKAAEQPVVGGGGAGFGTNGPLGVTGAVAGPGTAYGSPTLTPLWGGSPGGRGGVDVCASCGPPSPGGGGGGAVDIVACGELQVGNNVRVVAGGGGGAGGLSSLVAPGSGGGGGGSGGGILIEAETLNVGDGVVVAANGGGGGGGGQGGQGNSGQPGDNGHAGSDVAPGGGAMAPAGAGGDGGTRGDVSQSGKLPIAGKAAGADNAGSGGSGGAAGRIRINTRAGGPISLPGNIVISPSPSVGAVARHILP